MSESNHIQSIPMDIKFTLQTNDDNDLIIVTAYTSVDGVDYIHDVFTYDTNYVVLSFDIDGEFLGVIPNMDFYQQQHEQEYEQEKEQQLVSNNKRRKGNHGQTI